jgi:hypothetical protein
MGDARLHQGADLKHNPDTARNENFSINKVIRQLGVYTEVSVLTWRFAI